MLVTYLADLYSRKTVFLITSFLCHATALFIPFTTTYHSVLIWRGLSGICVISSLPIYLSILGDTFPPSKRSAASVISSTVVGFGMLTGQTICGYVSSHFGWRSYFRAIPILGMISFCFLYCFLPPFPSL